MSKGMNQGTAQSLVGAADTEITTQGPPMSLALCAKEHPGHLEEGVAAGLREKGEARTWKLPWALPVEFSRLASPRVPA